MLRYASGSEHTLEDKGSVFEYTYDSNTYKQLLKLRNQTKIVKKIRVYDVTQNYWLKFRAISFVTI